MEARPKIISHSGLEEPSHIVSWLHYRDITNDFSTIPIRKDGQIISKNKFLELRGMKVCKTCADVIKPFRHPELGMITCICDLMDLEVEWQENIRLYGSPYRNDRTLDQLELHGSPIANQKMRGIIAAFREWVKDPKKWVILYGNPGCGKTHMMEAITKMLFPAAMYVSSDGLNQKIFNYVGKKEFGLDVLIKGCSTHPILMIDDWGMGHNTEFTLNTLQSIVNNRYTLPHEFVTVLSTNLSKAQMYDLDYRVTSRLFEVATWVDMTQIPDYRMR